MAQQVAHRGVGISHGTAGAGGYAAAPALAELRIDLDPVAQGDDGLGGTGIDAAPAADHAAAAVGADVQVVIEILGLLEFARHPGQGLDRGLECLRVTRGSQVARRRQFRGQHGRIAQIQNHVETDVFLPHQLRQRNGLAIHAQPELKAAEAAGELRGAATDHDKTGLAGDHRRHPVRRHQHRADERRIGLGSGGQRRRLVSDHQQTPPGQVAHQGGRLDLHASGTGQGAGSCASLRTARRQVIHHARHPSASLSMGHWRTRRRGSPSPLPPRRGLHRRPPPTQHHRRPRPPGVPGPAPSGSAYRR